MSDTYRIFIENCDIPAWKRDPAFLRFVEVAMPLAYERYADPKNRAKGEPPEYIGEAVDLLIGEMTEMVDALDERNGWRDAEGNAAFSWELGDVIWCAMIASRAAGRLG